MLKEMVHYFPAGVKLFVMYDIACTLKKYLEVNDNQYVFQTETSCYCIPPE